MSNQHTKQTNSDAEQLPTPQSGKQGKQAAGKDLPQELPTSQGENSASGLLKYGRQNPASKALPGIIPNSQSPSSPAQLSKSPAASERFFSPASGASSADKPSLSPKTSEPRTRIIPDSSDEIRKSNKSPQGADFHSPQGSSQPRLTIEALPRVLPKEVTDTSEEVQRSNEDPKSATLHTQSTRKGEPTQPQLRAQEIFPADHSDRDSSPDSEGRAQHDSQYIVSANSKGASDLSAPVASQWPLLNEEGIQHGSGSVDIRRSRSFSPTLHEAVSKSTSEEDKALSPSFERNLRQTSFPKDGSEPPAQPIVSDTYPEGNKSEAWVAANASQNASQADNPSKGGNKPQSAEETTGSQSSVSHNQAEQSPPHEEGSPDPVELQGEPLPEEPPPKEEAEASVPQEQFKLSQSRAKPFNKIEEAVRKTDTSPSSLLQQKPAPAEDFEAVEQSKGAAPLSQPFSKGTQALDPAKTPFAIRTVMTLQPYPLKFLRR